MFPSAGNNANRNLQRSKSAASVKERRRYPLSPDPPDPDIGRLHALIAAHKAMDRARAPTSDSMSHYGSRYSKPASIGLSQIPPLLSTSRRLPLKSQSQARSSDSSMGNAYYNSHKEASSRDQASFMYEFGSAGENYGAEPSSYRHIRRTRSMLTPERHFQHGFSSRSSETPLSQAPTLRNATSSASLQQPGFALRLRRSFNRIRSGRRSSASPVPFQPELSCRPESIALARAQFLENESRSEGSKSSRVIRVRDRGSKSSFRKSLRSEDIQNSAQPTHVVTSENTASVELPKKKRSISASLRNRFMKTFVRPKRDDGVLPPQQLCATRNHFEEHSTAVNSDAGFDSYYDDNDVSKSRRNSIYMPADPCQDADHDLGLLSQKLQASSSRDSLPSNSKSRVTSWTNSTLSSSLRETGYEPKRLSVIKEDGAPYQPSSSAGRHIGGVSVLQRPLLLSNDNPIDSQRIYSALIKRIDQEQFEMEATQAALEEIHEDAERNEPYNRSRPTIRAVQSCSSISSRVKIEDRIGSGQGLQDRACARGAPLQRTDDGADRYAKSKVFPETQQATFFPFTSEQSARGPSPFRRFLTEQREQQENDNSCDDAAESGSIIVKRSFRGQAHHQSDASLESIYSRTTNGGANLDYISPAGSNMELDCGHLEANTGVATILPPKCELQSEVASSAIRVPSATSASTSEASKWKGWIEAQMAPLSRKGSRLRLHKREHAQINQDDVEIASADVATSTRHNWQTSWNGPVSSITHPVSQSQNCTSTLGSRPEPVDRSAALDQASVLIPSAQQHHQPLSIRQPNMGLLRKLSPSNVASILKSRPSQPALSHTSHSGKENKTDWGKDVTPISTPGRFLQMRSGNSTGRLRKKSTLEFSHRPEANLSLSTGTPSTVPESPSVRLKASLSARLSRPFDMEVPPHNRPFDSMYLGKGEFEPGDGANDNRLSIAPNGRYPRKQKTYDTLRSSSNYVQEIDCGEKGTTALPRVRSFSHSSRSTSFGELALHSKRIVSNFLRNRHKENNTQDNQGQGRSSSPAFL